MIDRTGAPVVGKTVTASNGASATTDAEGRVTLEVEPDTAVSCTINGTDRGSAYVLTSTMFGVDPGVDAVLPIYALVATPPTVQVTIDTGGINWGTRVEVHSAQGCSVAGTVDAPLSFVLDPACAEIDGTTTLTAAVSGSNNVVAAEGVVTDVVGDVVIPVRRWGTDSIQPAAQVVGVPAPDSDFADLYLVHQGQTYGEPSIGLAGWYLYEASYADGLALSATVQDTGTYQFVEERVDNLDAINLDGSVLPTPPNAVTARFIDGALTVAVHDPGATGDSTELDVGWTDADGTPHAWTGFAAAPSALGTRAFALPEDEQPGDGISISGGAAYLQADFAPDDWRTAPSPLLPGPLIAGERAYATRVLSN